MTRRIVLTVVILAAWVGLMGTLHRRVQRERALELDPHLSDEGERVLRDEWMALRVKGEPVGHLRVTLAEARDEQTGDGRFVQTARAGMQVEVMGVRQHVRTEVRTVTDQDLALCRFRYHLDSTVHRLLVEGERTPAGLHVRTKSMGTTLVDDLPCPAGQELYLPETLRLVLLRDGLVAGATREFTVFDPATQSIAPARVVVLGRETIVHREQPVECWKLLQTHRGLSSTLWLDDRGGALREESLTGMLHLVATAVPPEEALASNRGKISTEDLLVATRVKPDGTIGDPRGTRWLQVRLGNVDLVHFPHHGGKAVRSSEREAVLEVVSLPRREPFSPLDLAPTLSMPSAAPALVETASRVTVGEPQALGRARLLADWVHASVRKIPRITFPQATEVLESMAGDCNEHAVLFGALCRAAGIPCRVVAGLVALEDGYFYYHAWNEVCPDGEHWIAVDTAFGQWPADATHLKLVQGELGEQAALLQAIGTLRLQVLGSRTTL